MKKYLLILLLSPLFSSCDTARQVLDGIGGIGGAGGLSTAEISSGLKEALTIGTNNGTNRLSALNGFFANAAIKILMPEEAKKVESTLRSVGLGNVVDKAVLSMNRAAEDAAKFAGNIFIDAIRQMSITDAVNILRGGDFAATNYFKQKTTMALLNAFKPTIDNALVKTNATKYWQDVFSVYNQFATTKVNTDLSGYVTQRAVDGIFYEIGLEEQRIRQNPAARVTDLLRRVFGSTTAQGS
jgi:hypothetical protein